MVVQEGKTWYQQGGQLQTNNARRGKRMFETYNRMFETIWTLCKQEPWLDYVSYYCLNLCIATLSPERYVCLIGSK